MKNCPKFIAFYFPQFHTFPENDKWWGKGFTDWKLVKEAKPLYDGHQQPKLPMDGVFYNPCKKDVLMKQAKLAKEHGIEGFMIYHYWYDGKLLLEKPLETLRDNKDIDISYCVCWANETWSRTWIGKPQSILIEQKHTPDKKLWLEHFNYLLPFFKDKRAIKKDNKPVIVLYKPDLIKEGDKMISYWRELAVENGLEGLYVIANKNHTYINDAFLESYDGLLKFQPREIHNSSHYKQRSFVDQFQFLRTLPVWIMNLLRKIKHQLYNHIIIDSKDIWKILLDRAYINDHSSYNLDIYESGFFHWDNTPRYKNKARIFTELTKDEKIECISKLRKKAIENNSEFIFWNAWNEWSEGTYLEPDNYRGYENLEVVKTVFKKD